MKTKVLNNDVYKICCLCVVIFLLFTIIFITQQHYKSRYNELEQNKNIISKKINNIKQYFTKNNDNYEFLSFGGIGKKLDKTIHKTIGDKNDRKHDNSPLRQPSVQPEFIMSSALSEEETINGLIGDEIGRNMQQRLNTYSEFSCPDGYNLYLKCANNMQVS